MKKWLFVFGFLLLFGGVTGKAEAASKDMYLHKTTNIYENVNDGQSSDTVPQQPVQIQERFFKVKGMNKSSDSNAYTQETEGWVKFNQSQLDSLVVIDNQSSLFLQEDTPYYSDPTATSTVDTFAPQRVEVEEQWFKVSTTKGTKWVKFTPAQFGNIYISDLVNKLYIKDQKQAYVSPTNASGPTVVSNTTIDVKTYWIIINTWLGSKYIKFTPDQLNTLYLAGDGKTMVNGETKDLYDGVSSEPNGAKVGPQILTILKRWYAFDANLDLSGNIGTRYLPYYPTNSLGETTVSDLEFQDTLGGFQPIAPEHKDWTWVSTPMSIVKYHNYLGSQTQSRLWEVGKNTNSSIFDKDGAGSVDLTQPKRIFTFFNFSYSGSISTNPYEMNDIRREITAKRPFMIQQTWQTKPADVYGDVFTPVIGYMNYRGKPYVMIVNAKPLERGKGNNQYKNTEMPSGTRTYVSYDRLKASNNLTWTKTMTNIRP